MSIIETAYGETVAARLCTAIEALEVATERYQATGNDLLLVFRLRDEARRDVESREDVLRAHHQNAIDQGKNEGARRLFAAAKLAEDRMLTKLRETAEGVERSYARSERSHKNASAEMLSLRVAIAGYAAVRGAVGRG